MSMKKRIACFFTAGYTELNAMKLFMRKINSQVEYIQLCPVGTRRSKNTIKNRHVDNIKTQQNGLTGSGLIEFILKFVETKRFQEEGYDAILIEDDKDDRFLLMQPDGTGIFDQNEWNKFKTNIRESLHKVCPDLPVIFFFAAPEVESWFLADFENSFGSIYRAEFSFQENEFFKVKFRKYINDFVLTAQYKNCIEQYGYFNGNYHKLSTQIQNILIANDFLQEYQPKSFYSKISYSKRIQGEEMLRQIDPIIVSQYCTTYFKEGFLALKAFE